MRILIACGGTAGHIFPGLALADELKKENSNCRIILLVSSRARDRDILGGSGYILNGIHIETVGAVGFPYNLSFKYVFFAARLFWALLKSFVIILRYAPRVVVGFGGYASFAPLVIARIIGIPTLIHEQNISPGRANLLLARIVDRIAVSFEDTNRFFPWIKSRNKIVKVGLPLRKHILTHWKGSFTQSKDLFTILVVGGSQGAHKINELVLNCLSLMDKRKLTHLRLIHLAGKRDFHYVKVRYETLGVALSEVFDFLEDMASAYKIADLLISRSGASTIFEAASFGLPCILIPYARGTKHQKDNASYLKCRGAALTLDEESASCEDLKKILLELMAEERRRENLSQRISLLDNPGASHNLKRQIFALHRNRYVREQENC